MGKPGALLLVQRGYWELVAAGVVPADAGLLVGVSKRAGQRWFGECGGVKPQSRDPRGRVRPRLSITEREAIMIGAAQGESIRSIARGLDRAPSTIMREIRLNRSARQGGGRYRSWYQFGVERGGRDARAGYSAHLAQQHSEARARRPKIGKLGRCEPLRAEVETLLVSKYSPEQIAGLLAATYPDRPEMQVSHETIYKALYVQGRGELRRELTTCLRTGRALRKPRQRSRNGDKRGRIAGMVNISERPAEAQDRAVPGHWESQCCCQAA
jgi:IS30 family transposase